MGRTLPSAELSVGPWLLSRSLLGFHLAVLVGVRADSCRAVTLNSAVQIHVFQVLVCFQVQDFISQCVVRFSVCDVTFRSIWSCGKTLLCDKERRMLRPAVRYGLRSPVLVAWLRLMLMAAPFRSFSRTSSTTVKHAKKPGGTRVPQGMPVLVALSQAGISGTRNPGFKVQYTIEECV